NRIGPGGYLPVSFQQETNGDRRNRLETEPISGPPGRGFLSCKKPLGRDAFAVGGIMDARMALTFIVSYLLAQLPGGVGLFGVAFLRVSPADDHGIRGWCAV